nr:hypothetical protein [uncultured Roseateles sp.]
MVVELASAAGATAPLEGQWAGDRLQLVIDAAGGRLQADCASGSFAGPLTLSAAGTFTAVGEFDPQQPGPQRADEPPVHAKARYAGEVSGGVMKLSILVEGAASPQLFTLRKDARIKLIRCL